MRPGTTIPYLLALNLLTLGLMSYSRECLGKPQNDAAHTVRASRKSPADPFAYSPDSLVGYSGQVCGKELLPREEIEMAVTLVPADSLKTSSGRDSFRTEWRYYHHFHPDTVRLRVCRYNSRGKLIGVRYFYLNDNSVNIGDNFTYTGPNARTSQRDRITEFAKDEADSLEMWLEEARKAK